MNNEELQVQINGKWFTLDCNPGSAPINKYKNDFNNISNINWDFSWSIKLPATTTNCRAFDMIHDFNIVSDLRHRIFPCMYISHGYYVAPKGSTMKFLTIPPDMSYFEVQIQGPTKNFISMLKQNNASENQKTINDLSFTDSIVRGLAGYDQSAPRNIENTNLFFAAANFAEDPHAHHSFYRPDKFTAPQCIYGNQVPFVKYKHIINKILQENGGYELVSSLTDDYRYNRACFPLVGLKRIDSQDPVEVNYISDSSQKNTIFLAKDMYNDGDRWVIGTNIPVENKAKMYIPNMEYESNKNIPFLFGYISTKNALFHIEACLFTEYIFINGGTDNRRFIVEWYVQKKEDSSFDIIQREVRYFGQNNTLSIDIKLEIGDKIQMSVRGTGGVGDKFTNPVPYPFQYKINIGDSYFNLKMISESDENAYIDEHIKIQNNLPDVTQFDFFSSFVKQYGLTIDIDERNKKIYAYTMNNLFDNKSLNANWSGKYHNNSGDIRFKLDNYARNNNIKYKESSAKFFADNSDIDESEYYTKISIGISQYLRMNSKTIYHIESGRFIEFRNKPFSIYDHYFVQTRQFSDGIKINDKSVLKCVDETIDENYDLMEYAFDAPEESLFNIASSGSENIISIPELSYFNADGEISDVSSVPLFLYDSENTTMAAMHRDIDSESEGFKTIVTVGSKITIDGIDYSIRANDLKDTYLGQFETRVLKDVRYIEDALFLLTSEDIEKFNPSVPVYIDRYGFYFYINKIKNFVSGKLTKVDLIRI